MTATHCPACGSVRVYVESGALCPSGCGGIAPLNKVAEELEISQWDANEEYLLADRIVAGRCRKALELMALPIATLEHRSLGHYAVGGTLCRKAINRQGAIVANYNGRRVWLRPLGEAEPVAVKVVEVQGELV
jgi:hypothetical protein